MVIKVYVSGISGNKEVKKRQQRVMMILESRNISHTVVDITEPGNENEKDFMQNNSTSLGATTSDLKPRHPLPPQIFNDEIYCGDYDQFDLANENDEIESFLKVESVVNHDTTESNSKIIGNGTIESHEVAEESHEIAEEPHENVEETTEKEDKEEEPTEEEKPSETIESTEENNTEDVEADEAA